ncbi:hypothetical protein KIW84_075553 [Lathyrus oleraceus]|uniref:RNase H type-1 domain-containing protein n=2 Tax=Pisum sativum TaxID=3888 RepID=A0A9D4VWT5_PEA|nr:hypothetical protein KIW84_075553 [Pisum sativum]
MIPYSADAGPNGIAGIGKDCKKFSVSTMYIMLDDKDTSMEDNVWTDIWRLHSNKRIYVKEDTLHVLRDFFRAMALWMTVVHANMSKESHEDNYSRPSNMVSHINKIVQDYKQAEVATCTNMDHCKELKLIKWETPTMKRVKLNINGARDKQGNALCGGIIRGNDGEWIRGFSKYIGVCDNYTSELWESMKDCNLQQR